MRTKTRRILMNMAIAAVMLITAGTEADARGRNGYTDANDVKRIEVEAGGGFIRGNRYMDNPSKIGMLLFLEVRNNFPGTPFDISLQGSLGSFSRKNSEVRVNFNGGMAFFADYNWRFSRKVAPFLGLGAGFYCVETASLETAEDGNMVMNRLPETVFVINPRFGLELFEHLRITLEYRWMKNPYSFLGLNVGFAFGGGRK